MTGMREDLERRRHHRQPRGARKPVPDEWHHRDPGAPPLGTVRQLRGAPTVTCAAPAPGHGLRCTRSEGHTGRHAARGGEALVFQVWGQRHVVSAEVPC